VLKPQLKRVLNELEGRARGVEIDIEAEQEIAQQAGVTGTPTVQLFLDKELKAQWRGVKQRSVFRQAIEDLLSVTA
jgi:thioredoxin reductase (NADPH)